MTHGILADRVSELGRMAVSIPYEARHCPQQAICHGELDNLDAIREGYL